jgi:septal ring factor EnvC (AmiA/AmiB activator)
MNNQLQVILTEQNIVGTNAQALIEAFGAPFTEAGDILRTYKEIEVTDESQTELMKEAKAKRITLRNIRTGVENKRKELKEESLKTGKAIDSVARYIKENIEPAEDYLELQEKFADIKKAERLAKIKADRIEKLMQYTDDISMYNIDNIEDETFEFLLSKVKKEHDDKIAAEKAEAELLVKEEADRKAEQERVIAENAKLRAEAEAKAKQEAIESQKREAEIKAEADRQAKIEAEHQAELAAERAKIAAIQAEQRKKDEAIAKEKAEKEAAEAKAIADAKKAEMDALLSPDKDKLINFSNALEIIRKEKLPAVKTKQAQDVVNLIDEMITKMRNIIETKAGEL